MSLIEVSNCSELGGEGVEVVDTGWESVGVAGVWVVFDESEHMRSVVSYLRSFITKSPEV
jgi:hypothetical protein